MSQVRRLPVYKYVKSGKLVAIRTRAGTVGHTVIELAPDMKTITGFRNPKYVKSEALTRTPYQIEPGPVEIHAFTR